jgi:hypothetical protein
MRPVDVDGLRVCRTAHTGRVKWSNPRPVLPSGDWGDDWREFRWRDDSVEPGAMYVYFVRYLSDVHLCSNSVILETPSAPGGPRKRVPGENDALTLEIAGQSCPSLGHPFLAVARPSEPGGTFSWECLTPESAKVVIDNGNQALLRQKLDWPEAVWRVTYSPGEEHTWAYHMPGSFGFGIAEEKKEEDPAKVARREELEKQYVELLGTPEGLDELRRAIGIGFLGSAEEPKDFMTWYREPYRDIAAWLTVKAGAVALPELLATLEAAPDVSVREHLFNAIRRVDPECLFAKAWPVLIANDDIYGVANTCWYDIHKKASQPLVVKQLAETLQSGSQDVRIYACRMLSEYKTAGAEAALERAASRDRSALVRFHAAKALHCLRHDTEYRWNSPPVAPSGIDPGDAGTADMLLPEVVEAIKADGMFKRTVSVAEQRFRALGVSVLPAISRRLCSSEIEECERWRLAKMLKGLDSSFAISEGCGRCC